jgi:hypothetical protein
MQENDFTWFVSNYDGLYKKYGHKFLVIKDEQIIGAYDTYAAGVSGGQKTAELGTFIVQECNGDESAYTNYIASTNFRIRNIGV